uniref:Uncharacterized protein n=1 Tax=Oryza nivara TaxID=4536 RepID=A0A0E0GDW4_ORYNI
MLGCGRYGYTFERCWGLNSKPPVGDGGEARGALSFGKVGKAPPPGPCSAGCPRELPRYVADFGWGLSLDATAPGQSIGLSCRGWPPRASPTVCAGLTALALSRQRGHSSSHVSVLFLTGSTAGQDYCPQRKENEGSGVGVFGSKLLSLGS